MFIAYIYSPNNTMLSQIHGIIEVESIQRINTGGFGSFYISAENIGNTLELLQQFNRVKVNQLQEGGVEKTIIDGYIKTPVAETEGTTVELGDMNDFMRSKYIETDKNYTGKTLDFIVDEVVSEFNSRFDTGITVNCGVTDVIPDKEYSAGKDVLSIFEDLALSGYEFIIENNILTFKESIGIDKSISGDDFLEYVFDVENPSTRSIENPKSTFNGDNIANRIIVKSDNDVELDSDSSSIAKFGSVERPFSNSGTDSQTAAEILTERKESTREISFTPIVGDFFSVGVGDTVQILIVTKNPLNNYIGVARIIEKKIKSGDIDAIDIKVSTSKVKTLSFIEQIENLKKIQKNMQL